MPMQARRVQIIVTRDLTAGLTRSQSTVNLSAFDMLTGITFSRHATHSYQLNASTNQLARPTNL